ncbi:hypothetical protein SETIT_6G033400v2 [Setaria italica]|uniref:F-box domain-containing protein n=1 Tax=Setaria italica TaxID=4555 RepID=A0A368RHT3_SETIT|nr:putative F-box/LRR-repeat protein 23 [Setaria italica]RCV29702.1 hypothetical protein SETIT_6G033400v2 [Setaria italica]
MPPPSSGGSRKKPAALPPPPPAAPASMEERDWAALPGDILFAVFLMLGPREIMEGADRACSSWRRVAVGEPKLWRCVDMGKARQWSSTRKPWRATARGAVDRAAGQCEAFSGPCDDEFLTYLVERAPSLKILHLRHDDSFKVALDVKLLKKLPLLEDVDISLSYFSDGASQVLFEAICEASPQLQKLRMSFDVCSDSNYYDDDMDFSDKAYVIPVMSELHSLELVGYNLTAAGLTAIIDNSPVLESLNVTGGYIIGTMDQELLAKCARVKNLVLPSDSDEDYDEEYDPEEGYESDYIYEYFR